MVLSRVLIYGLPTLIPRQIRVLLLHFMHMTKLLPQYPIIHRHPMYVSSTVWLEYQLIMYFSLTCALLTWLHAASCHWIHGQNGNSEVNFVIFLYTVLCRLEFISFDCYCLSQVKLWDLSNNQPSCVASKSPRAVCFLFFFLNGKVSTNHNIFVKLALMTCIFFMVFVC